MEILFGIIGVFIVFFVGLIFGAVRERVLVSRKRAVDFALWVHVNCEPDSCTTKDKPTIFLYYDYAWFTLEELYYVYNNLDK
jgi:hypothetical protein